ncbi:hypothetical protein CAPTEDRAFT_49342, partial [Capitella teleta]
GWLKEDSDPDPWLQVDFEYSRPIVAIDSLGAGHVDVWYVNTYRISHSQNGLQWMWYEYSGSPKIFDRNVNAFEVARSVFDPPIEARFLRFHPLTFNLYASVRWELFTCDL